MGNAQKNKLIKDVLGRHLLNLAEYISLGGAVAGSIAAIASGQVAIAAAPLTLALSLNVVNRHRFEQQTRLYTSTAIADVHQAVQFLHQQVQALPSEPVNVNPITQSLNQLEQKTQTLYQQFNVRPETQAIAQLTDQLSALVQQFNTRPETQALAQLTSQLDALAREFKARPETQALAQLTSELDALAQQFKTRPETQALSQLTNQLNALALRLDNLPTPPEPVELSGIKGAIASLNGQLSDLSQQFNTRPEPTEIQRLDGMIALAIQGLGELEQQQQILGQINEIQQQLKNLDANTADRHNYAQQLKNDLEQRIDQLNQETAKLNERTQRLSETPRQLEELKHLTIGMDERTTALDERTGNLAPMEHQIEKVQQLTAFLHEKTMHLLNSTRNLDQMQQQLSSLQQLVAGHAQAEDKTGLLDRRREEFSGQVDAAIEKQMAELNQLLKKIQPAYEYELVFDRSGSRKVLLEALQQAKHRLILVCPWLTSSGADYQVIQDCKAFLERGGKLDIGWGHLKDIDEEKIGVGFFYNSLDAFENLRNRYPNRCQLKLLGTHEKVLVCDDSFAMLGSHNFLTSGTYSASREVGLRTNDPRIIAGLIKRFDDAKNLEPAAPLSSYSIRGRRGGDLKRARV